MVFKLGIVNFHYIRENFPPSGIHGVTPQFFLQQLEMISKSGFEFISLDQLLAAIENTTVSLLPEKSCLVTFDDGLRESYEIGKSLLDDLSIPGGYFICSGPYMNFRMLKVHKLHAIYQVLEPREIINSLEGSILRSFNKLERHIIEKQYPWDSYDLSRIKFLFNFALDDYSLAETLSNLFRLAGIDEMKLVNTLYMTLDQIKELGIRKELGSHTISHAPLAKLNVDSLPHELSQSRYFLETLSLSPVKSIAYPYGGPSSINRDVISQAKESGYACGFTMNRDFNSELDILERPLELSRFDTNDFIGGKTHGNYLDLFNDD